MAENPLEDMVKGLPLLGKTMGSSENEISVTFPPPGIVYKVKEDRIKSIISPPFPPLLPVVAVKIK